MPEFLEVKKSMAQSSNILDDEVRNNFECVISGKGRFALPASPPPGGFCIAFEMRRRSGSGSLCYRVWHKTITLASERYRLISEHLRLKQLPYFVKYRFIPRALRINGTGEIIPGIAMDWVKGDTLDEFLKKRWGTMSLNARLDFVKYFIQICHGLRSNGIAHGDLSCANIMVDNGSIMLIDYDSLFVAPMKNNFYQSTGGLAGFQHPERLKRTDLRTSIDDDNFSQIVILASLFVAVYDSSVVEMFSEKNLLFYSVDLDGATGSERLAAMHRSKGWNRLKTVADSHPYLRKFMTALDSIGGPLSSVPSICSIVPLSDLKKAPFIPEYIEKKYVVRYCTSCGKLIDTDGRYRFCPNCGHPRHSYIEKVLQ